MKLYAIVEQNQNRNSGAISVPFCLDSYDEAMKKVKELALSLLPQKAPKGSNFPWLSAALDDLVDNERESAESKPPLAILSSPSRMSRAASGSRKLEAQTFSGPSGRLAASSLARLPWPTLPMATTTS